MKRCRSLLEMGESGEGQTERGHGSVLAPSRRHAFLPATSIDIQS